jgi:hypothetical protein
MAMPTPRLVDASGATPARLYATITTANDVARLQEYIAKVFPGFRFTTFGANGQYRTKDLNTDLKPKLKLMKSDRLGTLNQSSNEIVWRKSHGVLAVRINNGTLFRA